MGDPVPCKERDDVDHKPAERLFFRKIGRYLFVEYAAGQSAFDKGKKVFCFVDLFVLFSRSAFYDPHGRLRDVWNCF